MIREYIDRIEFEESFWSQDRKTLTMYFIAPVELLDSKYPEAVSAELMVEFEAEGNDCFDPKSGIVEISPTGEYGDGLLDFDWKSVDMSYDEIELLLQLYAKWSDKHSGA